MRQPGNDGKYKTLTLKAAGEPVEWGDSVRLKPVPSSMELDLEQPFEVEQIYPAPGKLRRWRLANPYWELDLLVEDDQPNGLRIKPESRIKNIYPGMKTLDLSQVKLRFHQEGPLDVTHLVPAEPIDWQNDSPLKKTEAIMLPGFITTSPIQVVQEFGMAWIYAPVRRLDKIEMGKHEATARKEPLFEKQGIGGGMVSIKPPPAAGAAGATPVPAPQNQGPSIAVPDTTKAADVSTGIGPNLKRYVGEPTNQLRRLPVAVEMVIDPDFVEEVLTAFVNSPLHFQITQVKMSHARDVFNPTLKKQEQKQGEGVVQPAVRAGSGGPADKPLAMGDEDPNLMVLTVYGIASLYEPPPSDDPKH